MHFLPWQIVLWRVAPVADNLRPAVRSGRTRVISPQAKDGGTLLALLACCSSRAVHACPSLPCVTRVTISHKIKLLALRISALAGPQVPRLALGQHKPHHLSSCCDDAQHPEPCYRSWACSWGCDGVVDGDACPPGINRLGDLVVSLDPRMNSGRESAGLTAGWVTVVPVASPSPPTPLTRQTEQARRAICCLLAGPSFP